MTNRKVAQRIPFTPSKTQAALLEQCFGARRFAYNQQVEAFNTYDKESNPRPTYPSVTDMKNANEWLRDSPIPSNALSNAIMDFRKAQSAVARCGGVLDECLSPLAYFGTASLDSQCGPGVRHTTVSLGVEE